MVLLEACGADEAIRDKAGLGDAHCVPAFSSQLQDPPVLFFEYPPLDRLVDDEIRVAHILYPDPLQHLPDDDLDMLIVDLHALELIDFLDLIDQITLDALMPLMRSSWGFTGPSIRGSPRFHIISLVDDDVHGDAVFLGFAVGLHEDLPLAFGPMFRTLRSRSTSADHGVSFGPPRPAKSSATLGRPPVMSFVFVVSRGIFDMTSPANTASPSFTTIWAPTGSIIPCGTAAAGDDLGLALVILNGDTGSEIRILRLDEMTL